MSKLDHYHQAREHADYLNAISHIFRDPGKVSRLMTDVQIRAVVYGTTLGDANYELNAQALTAIEHEIVNNIRAIIEMAAASADKEAKRCAEEAREEAAAVLREIESQQDDSKGAHNDRQL